MHTGKGNQHSCLGVASRLGHTARALSINIAGLLYLLLKFVVSVAALPEYVLMRICLHVVQW